MTPEAYLQFSAMLIKNPEKEKKYKNLKLIVSEPIKIPESVKYKGENVMLTQLPKIPMTFNDPVRIIENYVLEEFDGKCDSYCIIEEAPQLKLGRSAAFKSTVTLEDTGMDLFDNKCNGTCTMVNNKKLKLIGGNARFGWALNCF